ncbi:acyltransferase-domain-containing protein [Leucosporidium creatinivorum]|uniref:Acyltransferase-domain-containing protein n=1 Tax=Leucosporidium creatinivorum TaxID=106004 RepID=A0A1Y2G2Q7_9BASI|nr:acyltransferase-domain-containing protein [Leucosporidium creatinivorum]
MESPAAIPLHKIPIRSRPPPSLLLRTHSLLFTLVFVLSLVLIHLFQLVSLPLAILAPKVYRNWILHSKESFACLLQGITVVFAGGSEMVLTAGEGVNLDEVCKTDAHGNVVALDFEKQTVWISNHQQYADWIHVWILFFMANISSGICIILKASLQWAPVVGPAMQLFQFIFLNKNKTLQKSGLYKSAKAAVEHNLPFSLLLFPEGTLVSRLTRPKSASFAAAQGIPDLTNLLLPRSTGLLYCLRTLSLTMPNLTLYDLTIGYEGVPPAGYAQDYFTLSSIFGLRVPSPRIHMHLRKWPLSQVPIGNKREGATREELDAELTEEERRTFEEWVRRRWIEKDELLSNEFYRNGEFAEGKQGSRKVQVRMRRADWATLASVPVALAAVVLAVRRVL